MQHREEVLGLLQQVVDRSGDYLGALDAAIVLVASEPEWSRLVGDCAECKNPAAFYRDENPVDYNLLCAICAANAAVDGSVIKRIVEE